MPIVADAAVAVRGDLKPFQRDLQGAGKQADTLGSKMKSALSPKNLALGLGIGVGIQQVTAFLGDSINAASDLNETVSKTGEIIGKDMLPEMEAWAETASDAFGQSKRQALDGAATFATFGKAAGLAGEDLAGFSMEMVELASDFASFHNASPEEAIGAIGAALRGESEPIRRFGVLLNDAVLKEQAFKLGLIETTDEALTPQIKVLAARAEIMAQSADAQGDFARTSDGLANSQRTLAARMEDAQAELGEKLLPLMLEFVTFMSNEAVPAISGFADALGAVGEPAQLLVDVLNNIAGAGAAFHRFLDGTKKGFSDLTAAEQQAVMKSAAHWEEMQSLYSMGVQGTASAIEEGEPAVTAASESTLFDPVVVAMLGGKEEAERIASETPGAIAQALIDNQFSVEDAAASLQQAAADALHPLIERAQIIAFLSSDELADGLRDGRPAVSQRARELKEAAEARLAELSGSAWHHGNSAGTSFADGMNAAYGYVITAAGGLAAAARGQIGINSEPEDPNSPLRGITKWGGNLVQTYADGILGALGTGSAAANALAGSLAPALGTTALAGAGTPSVGSGVTFVLQVEGKEKVVGTRDEVLDAWQQMASFTDRRQS